LVNWHERSGFCCRCGAPTRVVSAGWVRVCLVEGVEFFPRTDPAVIVAVTDVRERLLLARNVGWEVGRRSLLAGFVDAGEGASDAVVREVAEEVGVQVRDVVFVADQPWPFPGSLMLGFEAKAVGVGLCLDAAEIVQAQWYSREELRVAVGSGEVQLPGRLSIARRLIERWYGGPLVGVGEVSV
ncbi:NAD(+) diphosphatase, partial [Dermatophilus congolensis]|uniref:NAD(+) diphosphatase n=6 Tax=Dermatophilus congolensis TaxID=1863 RepID=UPI001AB04145